MRYHHVLNNPIGRTRIPLELHLCEACVGDYVRLQVNGNHEPGYFTEHEVNEEEVDLTDDPPVDLAINENASSFQQWYALMLRNRRNRRNAEQRRPDDDRDDVDGSENTASEANASYLPSTEAHPDADSDPGEPEPDPEPELKRQRIDNEDITDAQASSSGSLPPLITVAAAIPCAAANPLSQISHPLYQSDADGEGNPAERDDDGNDEAFDHYIDNSNRDHASALRRNDSSFR